LHWCARFWGLFLTTLRYSLLAAEKRVRPHRRPSRVRGSANRRFRSRFHLYVALRDCAVFFGYRWHTRQTPRISRSGTRFLQLSYSSLKIRSRISRSRWVIRKRTAASTAVGLGQPALDSDTAGGLNRMRHFVVHRNFEAAFRNHPPAAVHHTSDWSFPYVTSRRRCRRDQYAPSRRYDI